jgi:hypothetical protein
MQHDVKHLEHLFDTELPLQFGEHYGVRA